MRMLRQRYRISAANDNFVGPRNGQPGSMPEKAGPWLLTRAECMRSRGFGVLLRLLLIASFSALILVVLSGAFLIGLAFVGVLAGGLAGCNLIRTRIVRAGVPIM
jgi:hypothetical protein